MCHSVQSTDRTFVKGYGFLSFAKNMGKKIGKNNKKFKKHILPETPCSC